MAVKRLNYFTHQFLREQDFKDEQTYHIEMRRRHNSLLHGWGIVTGLEVQKKGEREITISPGMAIDKEGRELVLAEPVIRDLSALEHSSHTYIGIAYAEIWDKADHQSAGGVEGHTRVTEAPEIIEKKHELPKDGSVITLARVHLDDVGHVSRVETDASIRKQCGSSNSAAGWMRLPFKPTRLNPVRIDKKLVRVLSDTEAEEYEFVVDEATAYCDEKGARGSMQIPVPPSAKNVTGFRIAGTTDGNVTVHLFRVGWNLQSNEAEKTELLKETVSGPHFHKDIHVKAVLDESHALAVSVRAVGVTNICLVAAKFE
jgi:hypothetical protein